MSTVTASGALLGTSGTVRARTSGSSNPDELTETEVREALAEMGVRPTTKPSQGVTGLSSQDVRPDSDAEIYVGKHKNAETPTGKPFAVESYQEYLDREAPPGFTVDDLRNTPATTDPEADSQITTMGLPSFYLKEDFGSVCFGGKCVDVGAGVGIQLKSTGINAYARLAFDIYVGGASFAISSFSVGYGVSGKGVCLSNIGIKYSVLKLDLDVCLDLAFTGSRVSVGGSLKLCADPCPVIRCEVCKGLRLSLGTNV